MAKMAKKILPVLPVLLLTGVLAGVLRLYVLYPPARADAPGQTFLYAVNLAVLTGVFLLSVGLFLYQNAHGSLDVGLLFLALFALLWMYDMVVQSALLEQVPALGRINLYLSPYLSILAQLLFLYTRMARWRRPFLAVIALMVLSIPLAWLSTAGVLGPAANAAAAVCRAAVLAAALVFAVLEARDGSSFFRVLTAVAGALVLALAAVMLVGFVSGRIADSGVPLREFLRRAAQRSPLMAVLVLVRVLLLASSTLAVIFTAVRDLIRQRTEVNVLAIKYRLAQQSYRDLRARNEQVLLLRHDLRHHLTALAAMLDAGQADQAAEYIRALTGREDAIPAYVSTGNEMIDLIVNSRLADAARDGVQVTVKAARAPASLPVSDQDLCSLLMNALDNACQASAKAEDPRIELDMHVKSGFFCFWCENTCLAQSRGAPAGGPAPDGDALPEHGYGLRSMEAVAERCGGLLDVRREGTRFTLRLALPLDVRAAQKKPANAG